MEVKKKKKKNKYEKNVYRSMAMITQFGINMLVPIILCSFTGLYLDKWLNTSFLMIVLFFIGALAGFRNVYIFAKRIFSTSESDDKRDTQSVNRELQQKKEPVTEQVIDENKEIKYDKET